MATKGTNAKLLIDEFNFSCDTNSLSVSGTVPALDSTALCATANTFTPGTPSGTITHGGYYSGKGAGYIEQELKARLGTLTPVYVAALLGTDTPACPVYICAGTWGSQLTIDTPIDGLIALSAEWPATDGLVRGLRVQDGTLSATGAGTAYDFGAAGTVGGAAYLLVSAIVGTATNATVDVESSATEGGVYASEGTFTLSAVGVQVLVLSGTVNRWIRLNVTSLGGATSITAIAIVAVDGVTG